jgi:hypothetical protein
MNSRGAVRHLELFVPLRISASPSGWELCAETKWRAQGEFLRGGTDGSNPLPSSGESAANSTGGGLVSAPRPISQMILSSETRATQRSCFINCAETGMRMRRSQHNAMHGIGHVDIVHVGGGSDRCSASSRLRWLSSPGPPEPPRAKSADRFTSSRWQAIAHIL